MERSRTKRSRASSLLGVLLVAIGIAALAVVLFAWPKPEASSGVSALERATLPTIDTAKPGTASTSVPTCSTGGVFAPKRVDTKDTSASVLPLRPTEVVEGNTVYRQPPAPPLDQLDVAAFDSSGAKAGAKSGYTILTAHSYSTGWSLGNELQSTLKVGAIIKLRAGQKVACYRVADRQQLKAADYPADLYNKRANAALVLTVCSDYDPSTRVWRKRTVWYATPMK